MDSMERTRLAGALVDFLDSMGCSGEDVKGIGRLLERQFEVKEDQELQGVETKTEDRIFCLSGRRMSQN